MLHSKKLRSKLSSWSENGTPLTSTTSQRLAKPRVIVGLGPRIRNYELEIRNAATMKPRVPSLTYKRLRQLPTEDYQLRTLYKTQGARLYPLSFGLSPFPNLGCSHLAQRASTYQPRQRRSRMTGYPPTILRCLKGNYKH